MNDSNVPVAVVMGSQSDWETMKHAVFILNELSIPIITKIISAHRTPDLLYQFAESAEEQGLKVIIAGAGGAAHLPGMLAAKTILPVLGVPVLSEALRGMDSLLSIVQMPAGVPVATFAIGVPGAKNAALFATEILALQNDAWQQKLRDYRTRQREQVLGTPIMSA